VSGMMDKTTDVHDAMIALQREELTLQLSLQIRNKFVNAYQDIMRMPM
jgi:flagellar hook-basal body complex protein FliE